MDVRAVAKVAREKKILLAADNTFASPYFQRPLTQGADIVNHSTTKYISGHSDVIGGAVVTSDAGLHEQIRFYQNAVGAVPGPQDCYLSLRGLKTLDGKMVVRAVKQPDALGHGFWMIDIHDPKGSGYTTWADQTAGIMPPVGDSYHIRWACA